MIWVIVLVVLVLIVALAAVAMYNRLVRLRNRAENAGRRSTSSSGGATT